MLPIGKRYFAINLCGVVFAKGECDRFTLNHEGIHTEQIKELLVIGFYLFYVMEWILRAIQYRSFYRGYLNISFEREAYTHANDLSYIPSRPRFAFFRYFRKRK